MKIQNVFVKMYSMGSLKAKCDGITHIKTLPYLSVVQSLKGSYDISLEKDETPQHTGEGGVFIAPSAVVQHIVHRVDPKCGIMEARWLFLDVLINGTERIDSRFCFPTILPSTYQSEINRIFDNLSQSNGTCRDLSEIYILLDILLHIAKEKSDYDHLTDEIITYVGNHFHEKINYSDFAEQMHISVSSLFRQFKLKFNETPSGYINRYRILRAASMLEDKNRTIKEIAFSVGFSDEFYFSKLFKSYMKIPPLLYRENIEGLQERYEKL